MSDRDPISGEDDALVAAEYALGVLDGQERVAAERRISTDPGFAREVEAWQDRFDPLTAEIAPEQPGPHVWADLARRLETSSNVVELQLKRSLALWRSATAAAGALAAALALVVAWPKPAAPAPPVLTARLAATAGGPTVFVAFYDPGRKAIVLTPAAVSAAQDRSPELWLIPTGGKPIPLGMAAFESSVQMIPAASVGGGTLAVSVEPRGGSPTGQPTGPVIATGQLTNL
ncbi:anti-sigma factor domain-containing protein [Caulobacter sp. S45]|uniref:anti-sigma factor n=1 Tax=Caulobacter sp. S45 TaxID=1641861 RepID=UPI0015766B75|nr:anti-sigma factor [Caulobacter sp. S45]